MIRLTRLTAPAVLAAVIALSLTGVLAVPARSETELLRSTSTTAQTQTATSAKAEDEPLYREYRAVRIGMSVADVREKLGTPADKGDGQDSFVFSEKESAQVFYDHGKVVAFTVDYVGDESSAPTPKMILGVEVEPKPDGSIYNLVRYPKASYWVSYNRTGGNDPTITVTVQKMTPKP